MSAHYNGESIIYHSGEGVVHQSSACHDDRSIEKEKELQEEFGQQIAPIITLGDPLYCLQLRSTSYLVPYSDNGIIF